MIIFEKCLKVEHNMKLIQMYTAAHNTENVLKSHIWDNKWRTKLKLSITISNHLHNFHTVSAGISWALLTIFLMSFVF